MAVTSTASSVVIGDAKYHPVATITRWWTHVTTNTLSSGDVIFHPMWRVPKGANICWVRVGGRTVDGQTILNPALRVYDSASAATDTSLGTRTLSVSQNYGETVNLSGAGAPPINVSIADDSASPNWAHIVLKAQAATSGTGSTSIDLLVQYFMNK